MPRFSFQCECGKTFDGLTTLSNHDVCECGKKAKRVDTIAAIAVGRDYSSVEMCDMHPEEVQDLLEKKAIYERESAQILSGEVELKEAGPRWSRPQCPEELRRRYY